MLLRHFPDGLQAQAANVRVVNGAAVNGGGCEGEDVADGAPAAEVRVATCRVRRDVLQHPPESGRVCEQGGDRERDRKGAFCVRHSQARASKVNDGGVVAPPHAQHQRVYALAAGNLRLRPQGKNGAEGRKSSRGTEDLNCWRS